jgi:hypothetical protein
LHGGVPHDATTLTGLSALKKMKEKQLKPTKVMVQKQHLDT